MQPPGYFVKPPGGIPLKISSKALCRNVRRGILAWSHGPIGHFEPPFFVVQNSRAAVQNSPHTFSTRIHHTFLRSKLPKTSIGANIDSRGRFSPFQTILHLGLHPPTPWGHAGGLVWVESSKQSWGTGLNFVLCSFRGSYSTHCKSCEKASFWTKLFVL